MAYRLTNFIHGTKKILKDLLCSILLPVGKANALCNFMASLPAAKISTLSQILSGLSAVSFTNIA